MRPPARADEGGTIDSAGLVWTGSQATANGTWYTWDGANWSAGQYAVWDFDAAGNLVFYDDWRLPTVTEIQRAIDDGTLSLVSPRPQGGSARWGVWSSSKSGNWAILMDMDIDPLTTEVLGGGYQIKMLKGSGMDTVFVRGQPAPRK